jgi:hypothetical protein
VGGIALKELWSRFKTWVIGELHIVDVVFGGLGMWGWFHNMESTLNLDLGWLVQFYAIVRGYLFANKAVDKTAEVKNYRTDSELNSPPNTPPLNQPGGSK